MSVTPVTPGSTESAIVVTASPDPAAVNQEVDLKAVVSTTASGAPAGPVGEVTFLDGTTTLGEAALNLNSVAIFHTTTLAAGNHTITAIYAGDAVFASSTSSAVVETVSPTLIGTKDILQTSTDSVTLDSSVTLTASVSGSSGSSVPTGTVKFWDGSTSLGSGTLDSTGTATFVDTNLATGTHVFFSKYSGDSTFAGSTAMPVSVWVVPTDVTSTTSLLISSNPAATGEQVSLIARVTGPVGVPLGSVTFLDGTATLGVSTITAFGYATFNTTTLATGSHTITAEFGGDVRYNASTSDPVALTVSSSLVASAVNLTVGPQSAAAGTMLNFTATVSGGSGTPTGTITFYEGLNSIQVVTLNGTGTATLSLSSLRIGGHLILAVYSGDNTYAGSMATKSLLVGTAVQRYIESIYLVLLHRDVDAFGLKNWTAELNSGQGYAAVAAAITSSHEYLATLVDGLYVQYLKRHADAGGLNSWISQLQAGKNIEDIRAAILGSTEYYNSVGGTNALYVKALYQDYLNRAPEASGLKQWENALSSGGAAERLTVATAISNSDESLSNIIDGFYMTYLHRHADAGGLAHWKQLLANGISQATIIADFTSSAEYLNTNSIS